MSGSELQTITGTFSLIPNPCTTRPCLPGMAFAVVAGDTPYFLAQDGKLWMQNCPPGMNIPTAGAQATVTGMVEERRDVNDCLYRTIESVALLLTAR